MALDLTNLAKNIPKKLAQKVSLQIWQPQVLKMIITVGEEIKEKHRIMLFLPKEQRPFFAFPEYLVQSLSCPNNLEYSPDSQSLQSIAKRYSLIEKENLIPVETVNVTQLKPTKDQFVAFLKEVESFVSNYSQEPSLPYKCPRLNSFKSVIILISISAIIKLVYGLSATVHSEKYGLYVGDSEFHRHWLEVTTHLPVSEWYVESGFNPRYFLFLDYPVVTAYFHGFIGRVFIDKIVPEAIEKTTIGGRGQIHTPDVLDVNATQPYVNAQGVTMYPPQCSYFYRGYKYFFVMRVLFVIFDSLLLGTACLTLAQYLWRKVNPRLRFCVTLILLLNPILMIVDHGNPQVNFLMVSFFLLAVRFALSSHFALSASFALLSVFSKITALSVMPSFAVLVLARLYHSKASNCSKIISLARIGIAVAITFLVIHFQLLISGTFFDMYAVLFQFNRQAIQQSLPTFWRAVDLVINLRDIQPFSPQGKILRYIMMVFTTLAQLPAFVNLARRPTNSNFLLALQLCSLSFFLFGYSTHEKVLIWFQISLHFTPFNYHPLLFLLNYLCSLVDVIQITLESDLRRQIYCFQLMTLFFTYLMSKLPRHQPKITSPFYPSKIVQFILQLPHKPYTLYWLGFFLLCMEPFRTISHFWNHHRLIDFIFGGVFACLFVTWLHIAARTLNSSETEKTPKGKALLIHDID